MTVQSCAYLFYFVFMTLLQMGYIYCAYLRRYNYISCNCSNCLFIIIQNMTKYIMFCGEFFPSGIHWHEYIWDIIHLQTLVFNNFNNLMIFISVVYFLLTLQF